MHTPYPLPLDVLSILKETHLIENDQEAAQPALFRDFLDKSCDGYDAALVEKQDLKIEFNDVNVSISILRPVGSGDKILPVILYLHGGGWVVGSYRTHRPLINELVKQLNCCIVFVNYSLSPEVKHPVALEECYATLCWVQQNAASIYATAEGLVVAGDSAGGHLSAALTILAKQRGNQGITYQALYYPVTDVNFESESYVEHQNDDFLPRSTMQYFWGEYLDRPETHHKDSLAVPMACESLEGLPPALVVTAERDVLRSEGEAYAKRLTKAGVSTLTVRYLGVKHGFITVEESLIPQAMAVIYQTKQILKTHWDSYSKL